MSDQLPTLAPGQMPANPEELQNYFARYAQAYAEAEPTNAQSVKVSNGTMSIGDQAMPGGRMAAIILDAVHVNTFYPGSFNPSAITPPTCYAIGRGEHEMAPHPDMARDLSFFQAQAERCSACPHNVYGSAAVGKGKACRNRRRLVLILAGTYDVQGNLQPFTDPAHYDTAPLLTLHIAPTSAKNWGSFVRTCGANYQRPPFGMIANVYVYPHEKHGKEAVGFEILAPVPDEWALTILRRQREAQQEAMQGYEPPQQQVQQPQMQRGGGFAR